MRFIDCSLADPAANLALDEQLLDAAETGRAADTLRLWESPALFVVLGVAQKVRDHINVEACENDGVPILRRCSAGGCVLQGPGCLNYSLVLSQTGHPDIAHLRRSYDHICGRLCDALQRRGVAARHEGVSDLAVDGLKISGSAQKRRKHFILHHGTLLYDMDSDLMERYLLEPNDRPDYRGARNHRGFVAKVPLSRPALSQAVREAFDVTGPPVEPQPWELDAAMVLVGEKYRCQDWIWRR